MTAMALSMLPLRTLLRGKVRDVYEVDAARILLVATDRVSAFDVVMREAVPRKGAVLTQLTAWWLERLSPLVPHHMISADVDSIVSAVPSLADSREELRGRAMLCHRAQVFPVECVMRGYLAGSAWKEYRGSGTLAGEPLDAGLEESARLEPPLFSPATKAQSGHDENIRGSEVGRRLGAKTAAELERLSRLIYAAGRDTALARGIIIADTKFEFGRLPDGRIALVDEVLTPDSSRFWPADRYEPGRSQPSFDKQPLRDYLDGERDAGRWNGDAPPPPLPREVIDATRHVYLEAIRLITGTPLPDFEPR